MNAWRTVKALFYLIAIVAIVYALSQYIDPMAALAKWTGYNHRESNDSESGDPLLDFNERLEATGMHTLTGGGLRVATDDLVKSTERADAGVDQAILTDRERQMLLESAVALHAHGRIDEAILAYHNLLARNPTDGGVHLNLALAYYQQGDYKGAWREVYLAEKYGRTPRSSFLEKLGQKMPDPLQSRR